MSTPDAAAAALDPAPNLEAKKITSDLLGGRVIVNGTTGILNAAAVTKTGDVALSIRQDGRPFDSVETVDPYEWITYLGGQAPSPYDDDANVDVPEHVRAAREMAEISDTIAIHKAELEALNARYGELAKKIMAYYEMAGDRKLPFDGRSANLRENTFPLYRDRPSTEGGGKYTSKDVVAVFRAIGREGDITPESVNAKTLGSILREYRDNNKPVPPELDAVVELGTNPTITITKPTGRRL